MNAADMQIPNTAIGALLGHRSIPSGRLVGRLLTKPALNLAVTFQGHRQAAAR